VIDVSPVTLEGRWVRLEPLRADHLDALTLVAGDAEIWTWFPWPLDQQDYMREWLDSALEAAAHGDELPFVIAERESGTIIGSTRFMDIRPGHRAVEIGSTWLETRWWRTAMNSEAKYLMLLHAFGAWGCLRVALKTDLLNVRSQRAIERLGAVREGVLRKHMIVHDGRVRDTVYYSILDDEWPPIRARMETALYGADRAGAERGPRT
jgi:RimJ/RimL family protein N-acetyltransferase